MIYLSNDLIEIQHLGLGQYSGTNFKTMINPNRIQLIRTAGPKVHLEGENTNKRVFQVIFSHRGFTESFVIEGWEYIRLMIFLALGYEGFNYYMTHDDNNIKRFEEKALDGYPDPDPGALVFYIKGRLELEKRKLKESAKED